MSALEKMRQSAIPLRGAPGAQRSWAGGVTYPSWQTSVAARRLTDWDFSALAATASAKHKQQAVVSWSSTSMPLDSPRGGFGSNPAFSPEPQRKVSQIIDF